MTKSSSAKHGQRRTWSALKKWLAGTGAAAVVASTIVAVGVGVSPAQADPPPAPSVSVTEQGTYIAGEDLTLELTFASTDAAAGDQFNLSAVVLLPADVTVIDTGTLGRPTVYAGGDTITGSFSAAQCAAVGLEAGTNGACVVPEDSQLLVFLNVSDLPQNADTEHTLTLRPDADTFEVGSTDLDVRVTAFTSADPTLLPAFPGSTTIATTGEHTSQPGTNDHNTVVNALRIEKTEPSPESELLRGVHENYTEYTLRVFHTGEGDIANAYVIDFLPAGLEYLGLGGIDNTTNANGTQGGAAEYPGAASLSATPPPSNTWHGIGETVETVVPTADEVTAYGLEAGDVYTKVTWNLGDLLATGYLHDITQGVDQAYPGSAGRAGYFEITYRAGVPLFENTLDFDDAGGQPAIDGAQAANLDNNRGPSTRHGSSDPTVERGDDGGAANVYTNTAVAYGDYDGVRVSDVTSEDVHAVDVRVLKDVSPDTFEQGEFVRYTLNLATSEYVTASLPSTGFPYRLVDDLADGLCPVFPVGSPITGGAEYPRLLIGDPNDLEEPNQGPFSPEEWNARLGAEGVVADCFWNPAAAGPEADVLTGATLNSMTFDVSTGRFYMGFSIDAEVLNQAGELDIAYSVRQNEAYLVGDGVNGATSSGDWVDNSVEFLMLTEPIDDVLGIGTPNLTETQQADLDKTWNAWDDSRVVVQAALSKLDKWVLPRSAGVPTAAEIIDVAVASSEAAQDGWVKHANDFFSIGDEVWYRIDITPPSGADVRNPKFTDFLPAGVEFDETDLANNLVVHSPNPQNLGTCQPATEAEWLTTFVPAPTITGGKVLTWNLGSTACVPGNTADRFLPLNNPLQIFIKVTVTDISAFGKVDLAENLAKYQQENVEGEIFFLRDAASFDLAQQVQLLKGVRGINLNPGSELEPAEEGNGFNSNVDGLEVVQGDAVTYRLDIVGPQVESTDYVVWDALPTGVTKADIVANSFTVKTVTGAEHTEIGSPSSGWSVTVHDPSDATYPEHLRGTYAGRSIVVFDLHGVTVPASSGAIGEADAIEQGVTLGYTVTIPDGTVVGGGAAAQLEQNYVNDASIVSYGSVSNKPDTVVTLVPVGPNTLSTEAPGDDENEIADTGTFDPSRVFLPGTEVEKHLVSTEIGPNTALNPPAGEHSIDPLNADDAIVQGELATFEYSVVIPANTAVRNAKLTDNGVLTWAGDPNVLGRQIAYNTLTDSAEFFVFNEDGEEVAGFDWSEFTRVVNAADGERSGTLLFPEEFVNRGDTDLTFAVQLTVWVDDRDASNAGYNPNLPDSKALTNTATFTYDNPNGTGTLTEQDTETVTYREPNLVIAKTHDQAGPVSSDDTITYTLTITNADRVKSYENTVVDTVPAGVLVNTGPLATAGATFSPNATALANGEGGTITWSYVDFAQLAEIPTTATITYTAKIDPETGAGQQYVNEAKVTGYTLPSTLSDNPTDRRGDRTFETESTIAAVTATIEKGVRVLDETDETAYEATASAPIGETVQYEVDVTLNAFINYYDVLITDTLPESLSIVPGTMQMRMTTGTDPPAITNVTDEWIATTAGQTTTWRYIANDGHLLSNAEQRVITITYDVLLENDDVQQHVNSLTNTAELTWAESPGGEPREPFTDTSTVTVLNPDLDIVKDVKFAEEADSAYRPLASGNPDQQFTYRLTVSNTGNTDAHEITVTDTVPAGVVVDGASLPATAELTGNDAVTGGGTITWHLTGPLEVGATNAITLTYDATFAPSSELGSTEHGEGDLLNNIARVTSFESFPRDPAQPEEPTGRTYQPTDVTDTADVRPLFPFIELEKLAVDTSRNAYVGQPFEWLLTATNNGPGDAQTVVLTDTLPENWQFTSMVSITVAGVETVPGANPADPTSSELVWSFGSAADEGEPAPVLLPGQSIEIRFTATPLDPDAIAAPGVGDNNPHTNTLSAIATDTGNETGNADREHTGEDATDEAFLREADLLLQKAAVGGIVAVQTDEASPLVGLPVGTWVPGQTVVTGVYDQPQWLITVTNQGPNVSFGPYEIVDTQTLPDGVTAGAWSARYYASASDTVGTALTVTGTGTAADPFIIGGDTTSLAADGSDRIEFVASLTIDATATAAGSELSNTADVRGRTYENPENFGDNEDTADKPLTTVADLEISKVVTDPAAPNTPVVGSPITWQISVQNNGPSDSVSSFENPITITDVIAEGLANVTASSNGDWVPTVTRGGVASTFPAQAGDVVTWTYQGDAIAPGGTAPVSLTATILASHTGDLTNSASVTPGDTEDPVDPNNEDEVTVTPNDTTRLSITKTRVEQNAAGEWQQVTPDDAPFVPGSPIHYLITVTNAGPADARDVRVVDEVPTGLSYLSHESLTGEWAFATGGVTSAGSDPSWNTFTLAGTQAAGVESATSFVVTYNTLSTLTDAVHNWAEVTAENWDETDPSGPFDRDDQSTDHERIVDLGIVKTHDESAPMTPGTELSYTLVVTNHGPSVTEGIIEIVDSLPVGLSYVAGSASVTVPAGTTAPTDTAPTLSGTGDRVLTWQLLTDTDTFAVGESIEITFSVLIDPTLREGATLVNRATVDGPEEEPVDDPNPNEDDETVIVGPTTALMNIVKSVEDGPWVAGTTVTYTLTIENEGPSAVPASVTDVLPDGLTIVSMNGANWNCDDVTVGASTGTCEYLDATVDNPVVAALHPLGTSTIEVVAFIDPSVPVDSELVNTATLTWWDGDGSTDVTDIETVIVSTDGDLGIVKNVITEAEGEVIDSPALVTAGETVWYRLQVTNHGTSDAVGPITVTDVLPIGVTVPASLTQAGEWTVTPGPITPGEAQTVTFTLEGGQVAATADDAARGDAPVIEFEANLDPAIAHGELLTNTVNVTSPTADSNPSNNDDIADVEVRRIVDLAITKSHPSDDRGEVYIDAPLDFTIGVVNLGPSVATGVTVTDTVPAGLEVTSELGPIDGTGWSITSITLVDEEDPLGGTIVVASYEHPLGVEAPENEADPLVISTIVRQSALGTDPNYAVVTGDEEDADPENNEVEDPIIVRPLVTLVVEKTAVSDFKVGELGTFEISVENFGPHADPGPITVTDVLPTGLVYDSSPSLPEGVELDVRGGAGGSGAGSQTVEWIITDGLDVNERITLTFVVSVQQAAYPTVTNVVNIDSPAEKTPESVLSDDEIVEVQEADVLTETGAAAIAFLALALALMMLGAGVLMARLANSRKLAQPIGQ